MSFGHVTSKLEWFLESESTRLTNELGLIFGLNIAVGLSQAGSILFAGCLQRIFIYGLDSALTYLKDTWFLPNGFGFWRLFDDSFSYRRCWGHLCLFLWLFCGWWCLGSFDRPQLHILVNEIKLRSLFSILKRALEAIDFKFNATDTTTMTSRSEKIEGCIEVVFDDALTLEIELEGWIFIKLEVQALKRLLVLSIFHRVVLENSWKLVVNRFAIKI